MSLTSLPGKVRFLVTTQEMANQTSRALERYVDTKNTFYCESCNGPPGVKVGEGIEEKHTALFCSFPK